MTYLKELPACDSRFGRTDIDEVSNDNGVVKKTARIIFCCGYRETDAEECILCGGFVNIVLEMTIDTFIIPKKGRVIKLGDMV
jgi:hypothetical protein